MGKRCIYCSVDIQPTSVVDMCRSCMHGVWGEKMAAAIVANMEGERDKGNLELGCVSESDEAKQTVEEAVNVENQINPQVTFQTQDHNSRFDKASKHDVEEIIELEKESHVVEAVQEIEEIPSSEVSEVNFY